MKQGYSETEGKCYPLFFACKNDCLDIRIDGREQMKAKGKLGLQGFLSFLFLAAGWYLMQYFCAYVVLSGSMEPGDPDGICCGCGWTEEGMESGGCDYLPERKYGGDTPDRGKERGRILY